MTQEDKELLLKDLSAGLPYGVKVRTPYNDAILRGIVDRKGVKTTIDYTDIVTDKQTYPIRYIKPYLRPMSSMTEEEQKEFVQFHCVNICPVIINGMLTLDNESKMFDWLYTHHFDFRNLIERGLAIEVTEDNNPYKE